MDTHLIGDLPFASGLRSTGEGQITREKIVEATRDALSTVCDRRWPIENCVVFCADIYVAAGFDDPIADYRGSYATEAEAYARMGLFGVAGLHARVAKAMGWNRIEVAQAQDGDWGMGRTPAGLSSCIRYRGTWVNSRIGGFALIDAKQMIAAWSVCAPPAEPGPEAERH